MPETFDLIVRGGEVVNHAGRGLADVGGRGGKIVEIGDASQGSAGQVVDAGVGLVYEHVDADLLLAGGGAGADLHVDDLAVAVLHRGQGRRPLAEPVDHRLGEGRGADRLGGHALLVEV